MIKIIIKCLTVVKKKKRCNFPNQKNLSKILMPECFDGD